MLFLISIFFSFLKNVERTESTETTTTTTRGNRVRKVPPKFYSVPHNKIAEQGETVRFQCNVGGNPSPRVTWDRDHIAIKADASGRITFEERDDVRVLEIRNVSNEVCGPLLHLNLSAF